MAYVFFYVHAILLFLCSLKINKVVMNKKKKNKMDENLEPLQSSSNLTLNFDVKKCWKYNTKIVILIAISYISLYNHKMFGKTKGQKMHIENGICSLSTHKVFACLRVSKYYKVFLIFLLRHLCILLKIYIKIVYLCKYMYNKSQYHIFICTNN